MASVSSLLKSAEATRKKLRQQDQAEVAFQWAQSAKTLQDFQAYTKYLDSQSTGVTDPSELLSLRKTASSAQSAYISNEIQRQSLAVMSGNITSTDKYQRLVNLYYQAADSGNQDLAQSLANQLGSLSITIQNEHDAGQRAAQTMAMNQVTTLGKLIRKFKEGDKLLPLDSPKQIMRMPDGTVVKPLAVLNAELGSRGGAKVGGSDTDYFGQLLRTAKIMQQVVVDAYNGATTQEAVDSIENQYGDIITGNAGLVKVVGQTNGLTLQDLSLAYGSALAGNPIYSIAVGRNENTGNTEYTLTKNKINDFVWSYNPDGSISAVETRAKVNSQKEALNATLTDQGQLIAKGQTGYDERNSIQNRLANQGYTVDGNVHEDGTFTLVTPQGEILDQATVMPDGTVRYFGAPGQYSGGQAGLYEINIGTGNTREVAPDETSVFGVQGSFGQLISQPTKTGVDIARSLAGVTPGIHSLIGGNTNISPIMDVTGQSNPVRTTNLQGGSNIPAVRGTPAPPINGQTGTNFLQPSAVPNLNQTPVPQTAQNGAPIRQLQVVAPTPTPSISVQPTAPTPNVVVAPTPKTPSVVVAPTPKTPSVVIAR